MAGNDQLGLADEAGVTVVRACGDDVSVIRYNVAEADDQVGTLDSVGRVVILLSQRAQLSSSG